MSDVVYLEVEEVVEIHAQLLDRHGGLPGFKDPGAVESAVFRPRNKAHFEGVDLLAQAGALYYGLAKNHGFSDGNKRIAVAATDVFLQLNGWMLTCDNQTLVDFTRQCSDPEWTEEAVIQFVRQYTGRLAHP